MRFVATCKLGLEALVARELRSIGIEVEQVLDARVYFSGEYYTMARAMLWLRTAERVLFHVASFTATTFDELFEGVKSADLMPFLKPTTTIHVTGKSAKSSLFSVPDCQSITKKAIVENLKSAYHVNVIPEGGPEVIFEVGILRNNVTLALDPCGAGLTRRGYRTFNVPAPISETLGAAIVLLSRYQSDIPLIDPMCGSGTMPIEAAMIARNQAPGLNREFAAEGWPFLGGDEFMMAREEARDSIVDIQPDILGMDIDPHYIDLCKKHAKKAGIMVNWKAQPLKDFECDKKGGVIVCNPPYGERMLGRGQAEKLYALMREKFDALSDFDVNIITANPDFEKIYGKKAGKRRKLSNGGMQCTLYRYFRE